MKVPSALTTTVPLVVAVEPLYVRVSLSASVALTEPVTTPVVWFGLPTVGVPTTGAALTGLTATLTTMLALPARSSVTVTVKVSARWDSVAVRAAAACRADDVGV